MVKRSKDASAVAFTILYYKWLEFPTYMIYLNQTSMAFLSSPWQNQAI